MANRILKTKAPKSKFTSKDLSELDLSSIERSMLTEMFQNRDFLKIMVEECGITSKNKLLAEDKLLETVRSDSTLDIIGEETETGEDI